MARMGYLAGLLVTREFRWEPDATIPGRKFDGRLQAAASGAKARININDLAARLKPCPPEDRIYPSCSEVVFRLLPRSFQGPGLDGSIPGAALPVIFSILGANPRR